MKPFSKSALIVGAGPAGLTAAYELIRHTDIKPVIVDSLEVIGGLSATYHYKGNGIDIGGHRFFSKNESILSWWKEMLPFQNKASIDGSMPGHDRPSRSGSGEDDPEVTDRIMLIRNRLSRIYYRGRLFDYPLKITFDNLRKLGIGTSFQIGFDYFGNRLHPLDPERNLEDFIINRFGKKLYEMFFKNYTEKVWGIACTEIGKEWGSQRIKGVSISRLIRHALFPPTAKTVETSLIPQFYYPKLGAGQMWEEVARRITAAGGEIYKNTIVREIEVDNLTIKKVLATTDAHSVEFSPEYVFSSMPLKDFIAMLKPSPPGMIRTISDNLRYRDFIMVGILAKKMRQGSMGPDFPGVRLLPDTWIYLQDPDIVAGRLQIFNNWSPYMPASRNVAWIGMEFFCNEGDSFWSKSDSDILQRASAELNAMGLVSASDILDGCCIKIRKAYPAYWGSYSKLNIVKKYLCSFSNLFCIGRNGIHRYNNMDHSMLTAIRSVASLSGDPSSRGLVWDINSDDDYSEEG